jgi:ribosomal protein S1
VCLLLLQAATFWHRIKQMQQDDVPVYVTVTAATRGGLLVQYNHLEGFIPASHLGQVRAGSSECFVALA